MRNVKVQAKNPLKSRLKGRIQHTHGVIKARVDVLLQSTNKGAATARRMHLRGCQVCGFLSQVDSDAAAVCPRCDAVIHVRKPDSLIRTWAFLIAAMVLYIPANLLPIMQSSSIFVTQSDTILSGIAYLWLDGSWVLAVVVFIASFIVPLAKLIALTYLLITVQFGSTEHMHQRARAYRFIDAIGHWSMLDIFVVAILTSLVRIQPLALIEVGPGAVAFGGVVVLTLLATHAFDPRLIWDAADADHAAAINVSTADHRSIHAPAHIATHAPIP